METFLILLFVVAGLIAFEAFRRTRRLPRTKDEFTVGDPGADDTEPRVDLRRARKSQR